MNVGFETIGNAILICYDHGAPVLVTDPYVTEGSIAHRLAKNAYWMYRKSLR